MGLPNNFNKPVAPDSCVGGYQWAIQFFCGGNDDPVGGVSVNAWCWVWHHPEFGR